MPKAKKDEKAKPPRKAPKPTYKWCHETGEKILITTVTLPEIKRAEKTGDVPNAKKKQLVRIPSKQTRENCYAEAAKAIEAWENQVLPTFGGRPWVVTCRITEPNNRLKPPLFRWFRGALELAVLPHLLERVPDPTILQKGLAKVLEEQDEVFYSSSTDLCERAPSQLSRLAWNDTEYQIPTISLKWMSPNHKSFTSRKSAEERAKQLVEQQALIDKICFGHGARGQALRPKKPTKTDALKAGKLRFLRDGLWVVGQEESWQAARAIELEKLMQEQQEEEKKKPPKPPRSTPKRPIELFLRTQRVEYRQVMLDKLREIEDEPHFTLGDADRELREIWKKMIKEEKKLWRDLMEGKVVTWPGRPGTAQSRNGHAASSLCSNGDSNGNEGCVSTGEVSSSNAKPLGTASVTPSASDGDEVTGTGTDCGKRITGRDVYVRENREYLRQQRIDAQQWASSSESTERAANCYSLAQAEEDLKKMWVHLDSASRQKWEEKASAVVSPRDSEGEADELIVHEQETIRHDVVMKVNEEDSQQPEETALLQEDDERITSTQGEQGRNENEATTDSAVDNSIRRSKRPRKMKHFDLPGEPEPKKAKKPHVPNVWAFPVQPRKQPNVSKHPITTTCKVDTDEDTKTLAGEGMLEAEPVKTNEKKEDGIEKKVTPKRRRLSDCPLKEISQSAHWRLTQSQIDLCHDAATEHFDKVMYTVKARALFNELADGFDLLRERGRGRYDMELPVFDDPKFSFLTDLRHTPWINVVKQILGDEAVLIHKGVFLSNPGASAQNYHQDGPHLTQQSQRPCHAINVFVPLVDLTLRNGPTEFVAGSHILGYDDYDREKVVTPEVAAGTPIIFDYRLGHRGLANTSEVCRPILYCTYAAVAKGKEFRDSVNFSRKRYHRLGELVEQPLSRDERARMRKTARRDRENAKEREALEAALAESEKSAPPLSGLSATQPEVADPEPKTAAPPLPGLPASQAEVTPGGH